MIVRAYQLDGGALPNYALAAIVAEHRAKGDDVMLVRAGNRQALERGFWDRAPDRVYASLIFEKTRPLAERLLEIYPGAIVGGTGWSLTTTLEDAGIATDTRRRDFSDYEGFTASIGFTQRGCRMTCPFCHVPAAKWEGAMREAATVAGLWRGDPFPRDLVLLDNDFFGQPSWRARVDELLAGGFRVSFTQGINARLIGDEEAAALASLDYWNDSFTTKRLYCAWDNAKDERRLFAGLEALARHGVKPDHVMVYMLVGFWCGDPARLVPEDFHRQRRLREFGARPYPMPFVRTPELVGFQRWVVGAYDKRVSWQEWERARYRPERLGLVVEGQGALFGGAVT